MSVENDTRLISFQEWTLRIRPAAGPSSRLLLLLHGLSGDENSMWVFVRNFPPHYWILSPRAPYGAKAGGYSWRMPPLQDGTRPGLKDLREQAQAVVQLVDAYSRTIDPMPPDFDLIGFSQGAALANVIALLYPSRIRRAAVLSGFIPVGAESLLESRPLSGKSFFVSHGTLDETVDIRVARDSVRFLEQAGANVTFCEDQVGHRVSAGCLRALKESFS